MAMYNYTPNSNFYGANETEEERRRREQAAQTVSAGVAPVAPIPEIGTDTTPQPIKQTITYDPVTGEQRMKIEGSVQDLSPANPMTPTVSMPGQPVEPVREMVQPTDLVPKPAPVEQTPQLPPGVQMVNGKLQLAPTEPVQPMTQAQADMPAQMPGAITQAQAEMPAREPMAMPQLLQPGPAVQVAGPAQMPPAAQPQIAAPQDPLDAFAAASGNTASLLQIYNDKNQSPELRRIAGREAGRMLESETRRAEAEKEVQGMDQNQLARMLQSKSEEGSWGKRALFGLLNMQGAMAAEDAKLGIGAKYTSTQLEDGTRVLVKLRADGLPMEGYNATTGAKLDARSLAAAAGGGTGKLNIVGGTYVNDKTGEVGRVITDEKTGRSYVQTDTGRKSMTGFRPQASAGTLADMNTRQIQELNNQLAYAGPNASAAAREKVIAENEARFGPLPDEYKARVRGVAPQPATQQAAPAAATQQAVPATTAQQAAPAQTRPVGAVSPAQPVQQPRPSGGVGGATPAARETAQQIALAGAKDRIETEGVIERERRKPAAQATGGIEANDIKKQQFANSTYGMVKPLADLIKQSTGSGIGTGVDKLAALIGSSSSGAEAIAQLDLLTYPLVSNVPRFEGPQGVRDVELYERAAGRLNDSTQPVKVRLAALSAMVNLLKTYDKDGRNDWTFSSGDSGNIKIIKREKVQ